MWVLFSLLGAPAGGGVLLGSLSGVLAVRASQADGGGQQPGGRRVMLNINKANQKYGALAEACYGQDTISVE